jgi:hypothetical protein
MKITNSPLEGVWDVIAAEHRVRGEWTYKIELEAGEWTMGFLDNGKYFEIYRPENDMEWGVWSFDEDAGIITIMYGGVQEYCTSKCLLDPIPGGVYLYCYNDERHIRPDRDTIIAHHAHTRHRLVRV